MDPTVICKEALLVLFLHIVCVVNLDIEILPSLFMNQKETFANLRLEDIIQNHDLILVLVISEPSIVLT